MFEKAQWLLSRRRFLAGSASAATVATATLGGCNKAQQKAASKLAIVHTNDTHGHDLLNDESLGMAAAAQLKKDWEAKGYEVLLVDAGDFAQGENLVNHSKGDSAVNFMNTSGYDVACLGNHEFDYGQDKVTDYAAHANFPLLSANIIVDATGDTIVEPNTILTLSDGTRVGFFGLTTPATYTSVNPLFVRGLTFLEEEELYACAQHQADALRDQGCELVVCLAHLGEEEDLTGNRTMDLVAHTTGIDLVIDGHDHEEENQLIKNANGDDVLVVETGCYTHAVGVVTWEDGKLSATLEKFGSYDGQDQAVAAYVQEEYNSVYAVLQEVIATTDYLLDAERAPGIRTHETNMGDLVADSILWEAQQMADDMPDCAIVNGGGIRMTVEPGDITIGDVRNVLPYLNYVCTIQVTGAQLLEAVEASLAVTPEEMGSFPQVSGVSLTIDTRVPFESAGTYPASVREKPANPGSRVTIHDVGGRGFNLDDTYTIASIDFLCAGGDTYYVFAEAAQDTMKSINYLQYDCFQYYLQEACDGRIPEEYADPAGQGRIEIIE